MSITVQALDVVYGRPASGLTVSLEYSSDGPWRPVAEGETDPGGQISDWNSEALPCGLYRIMLATDKYFVSLGIRAAYPQITLLLRLGDTVAARHVQVLMAPHAYSTYYSTTG